MKVVISKLPHLNKIFLKGLLTFFRGVKIGNEDIKLTSSFHPITIDQNQLKKFKNLFELKTNLPLSFLYLLAQRAQVSLMLDEKFTIAIPGLIHISNTLEQLHPISISKELILKAEVIVRSKEGSLLPIFKVDFFQNEKLVASCSSTYLAKRKSSSTKKNRGKTDSIIEFQKEHEFSLSPKDAKLYSVISGDRNPIHTSTLAAKLFGFNATIIQGWYLVSKAAALWEKDKNQQVKKIKCDFINIIKLPCKVNYKHDENHIQIAENDSLCVNIFINN